MRQMRGVILRLHNLAALGKFGLDVADVSIEQV